MKTVEAPIRPNTNGENVANLQDTLSLMVEKKAIDVEILGREEQLLPDRAREERRDSHYGAATAGLVKIFRDQNRERFALDAGEDVDDPTAKALNRLLREFGALDGPPVIPPDPDPEQPLPEFQHLVRGVVRYQDGLPIPGLKVMAFDKHLRHEDQLGEPVTTDADGLFEIFYSVEQMRQRGQQNASLIVRVFGKKEGEEAESVLAESDLIYEAAVVEKVVLRVPAGLKHAWSEFEQLMAEITPLLEGAPISSLTEDEHAQELSFLSGKLSVELARIAQLVGAHKLGELAKIEPEVIYGLIREKLPFNLSALLSQSPERRRSALIKAVRELIVPGRLLDELDQIEARFQQVAAEQAITGIGQGNGGPLAAILSTTRIAGEQQLLLAGRLLQHKESAPKLWEALRDEPQWAEHVDELQVSLQLGTLTAGNVPLMQRLHRSFDGGLKSVRELTRFDRADWKTLVSERDADGKLQIPAEVSGKDDDEKITKYASILERMVQEAFPVETFAQRIQRDEGAPAATRIFFQNVLSNNVTLDLRRQPVEKMIEANPALIAGVVDKAALVQDLKTRQRLFKIVPVYEKMEPLLKAGLKSSADISRMGRWAFANQFAEVAGGTMQALKLHAQASYVTAGTLNLFAILSPWFRLPTYVLPEILPPVDGTPDWEELFGTFDLCRCQQCRSVHSPAAYLTELFAYLKERKVSKPMPAGPNLETNVRDLLFERRPDLGDIELTCDNTNIALPYVDLVAEALEYAIAPFVPFALPATAQAELDAADVSATVRGVFEGSQHKLTDDTVAVVIQPGESWLLTDHRRLYSIRQDAAAGAPRVMALGNQTSGTEPDLAANPSHVNAAAYVELSEAVHPWLLPLDLPTEETRVWLRQTGVERAALMAAFQPRSGTLDPGDLAIAGESLDLTTREVGIVTAEQSTPHHPWEFWGLEELNNPVEIPDPADPSKTLSTSLGWVEALAHVPILLRQSALSYGELLALLNTRLINPAGALRIESVDPRNRATCDLHLLRVTGLDERALDLLHRFTRLRRRLGWTVRELDLAIQVFQGNEVSPQARLSSGLIQQLAVSKRLEPELGLTRPRLLALWGNIDTRRGLPDDEDTSSLYEQLFLNPLVLKPVDGAFLLDGAQTELATMGTPLVAHEPALLAGLGITASELDDLKSAGGSATLSLNSLSVLFREVALAQGMGLAIAESLRWQQLLGLQPFAPTHPENTAKLVETVQQITAAGFSLGEVNYLLRHQFEPDDPLAPASDSVIQVLTELRAGLQKIESDSVIEADPTGEQTRKYLGLLKWDPAHVELVVGTLNAQPSFSTALDELPPGFGFPAALVSKVVWDAASHTLSVSGPLDATDQAALMAVALPAALQPAYNAAVGILAGQSAIFLQAVRAYRWPVFRTALALASMPANALIPRSLKTRFFYDRIANEVAFSGLMLAQDFEELKRIAGADATFLTALESLRNAMAAYAPSGEEAFFSPAEAAALLAGGVGPAQRFQTVLAKLVPRLERLRGEALVRQQLSTALAADADVLAQLLEPATMDELLAPEFAGSHASLPIETSRFPTLFDAFTRLGKGVLVTSRLRMNVGQLSWYLRLLPTVPTRPVPWTVAAAPAGWLDLRHLPLAANPAAVPELAAALLRLIALCQLRDQLRPGGEFALEEVFDAARLPVLVADPGKLTDAVAEILSRTANFEESDTKALLGAGGLGFVLPDSLQDETGLTVLLRCFQLARKVNASPANARAWAREAPGATIGAEIKQAQRARYGDDAWDKLAIPGQDALREKKRSALVAYLTTRPFTVATPTGTRAAWKDGDGLFAYFLIDVEMSACWKTSRIKQAISSVQLFVQRCLLNLEPGVHLDAVKDDAWSQWEWMKNYRVWEANRLVFLYPENWIEPELRDDKTPFFKDLENELQQNEITTDTAEEAFLHYLEKLDAVAKLELIGMYQQDAADGLQSVLHVFGRTMGTPSAYYYRSRTGSGRWTAWEKVDLDVEGDHVIPIVWNRRLYLFWAIFTVKATGTVPPKDSAGPPPSKYFEIQLGWSERKGQKWLPKKVTKERIRSGIVPRDDVTNDGRQKHTFFTSINPDGLRIWPEWDNPSSSFSDLRQDNYGQTPTIPTTAPTDTVTTFFFSGCAGDATLEQNRKIFGIFNPNATSVNATRFEEDPFVSITGGGGPTIFLEVQRSLYLPPDNTTNRQEEALAATPGSALYEILYPHQDYFLSGRRPFFFEDQTRAFLVEPEDAYFPNLGWQDTAKIDAGKYKLIVDHYYELAPKSPRKLLEARGGRAALRPVSRALELVPRAEGIAPAEIQKAIKAKNISVAKAFLDPEKKTITAVPLLPSLRRAKRYRFSAFYHPYLCSFIKELNRAGVDALMNLGLQAQSADFFKATYNPTGLVHPFYPIENVDFSPAGSYAQYNWEVFFHAPLLIAQRLMQNQRFAEARLWMHHIFDPGNASAEDVPGRFWRTKPFHDLQRADYLKERIEQLIKPDATGQPSAQLAQQIAEWRQNPFSPHAIARLRLTAYQKSVVMKYLDNLIAWSDQLFRQDTIESINEATQLYLLAAGILGPRPEEIAARAEAKVQTYNSLDPLVSSLSDRLVEIEYLVPAPSPDSVVAPGGADTASIPKIPYFCVPPNDKLLGYWDTVGDRLFKIRHCMNIEGQVRQLALFEPPIDPAMLVRAAAAGVDLSSVLNDMNAPLPCYRFEMMAAKATELCNEVKALGAQLLTALQQRDAEALALLRSGQEVAMRKAVRLVREGQIQEAQENLIALQNSKLVTEARRNYYRDIVRINDREQQHLDKLYSAHVLSEVAQGINAAASVAFMVPQFDIGVAGWGSSPTVKAKFGGTNLGHGLQAAAGVMNMIAAIHTYEATSASIMGGHDRRWEEWKHQESQANLELDAIDKQIEVANIRVAIAQQELVNVDLETSHAQAIDELMRTKYTNGELFEWMVTQISALYFQSYQLAYDVSKRAERAYRHELGLQDSNFVQFGYWDSLKKGLLAGERLLLDLKRMEVERLDQNKRECEITKHVSLDLLHPQALVSLRETGSCFFELPEAIFDLDHPGHYLRRIKSVSLSIPCVVGPYTSVNAKLTLLGNRIRRDPQAQSGYPWRGLDDPRFAHDLGGIQSIVTSNAQQDAGLFELNFRDERYLPFEGSGAISQWRLELPGEFRQFDYDTITDIVLHLRYTARDAGDTLKGVVTAKLLEALRTVQVEQGKTGLFRLFSLRHDFSDAWHKLLFAPPVAGGPPGISLELSRDLFPAYTQGRTIKIKRLLLLVKAEAPAIYDSSDPLTFDVTKPQTAVPISLEGQALPGLLDAANPFTLDLGGGFLVSDDPNEARWGLTPSGIPAALRRSVPVPAGGSVDVFNPETIHDIGLLLRYTIE